MPDGSDTDFLVSVWGTDPNDFFVAGKLGSAMGNGVIHHFKNGAWAAPVITTQPLNGIWGDGEKIYAVGERGLIVTYSSAGWQEQTIESLPDFRAISGSDGDAFAVAAYGLIWRISPP